MATLAELRSQILRRLNKSGAGTNEQADLDDLIHSVIREDICADHQWSYTQDVGNISLSANAREYPIPDADTELFHNLHFLQITSSGTDWYTLEGPLEYQTVYEATDENQTAEPEIYAIYQGDKVIFSPIPDKTYQVRVHYWKYPARLGDADSNFLTRKYPELLVYGVCARFAAYYGDSAKAGLYENIFQAEKARVIQKDRVARAPTNRVFRQSAAAGQRRAGIGRRRNRSNTGTYAADTFP